ncbi:SDR family NAD(P)-dependent oxidoreductase [Microbacterium sp. F2]|uniref:SDR family NAD(P)-dependent oxidoreductase n=1 Tax=Microbacterium sp. F2 TaxID=3422228 RepID=UPI003FD4A7C8
MSGPPSFDGLVAVVTGGASGIGRGIAEALIAAGAEVVIADIEQGPLDATAAEIGALPFRLDVSRAEEVQALADLVIERWGRVDIVCNNAGVGYLAPFDTLTRSDFGWVLDVNLGGVINGMTVFLPLLRETSASGWMVNTASMAGLFDAPGMAAYAASKFAVVALTETVAQELAAAGAGVGISVLVPGLVNTAIADSERNRQGGGRGAPPQLDQIPPGRALDPGEVGALVVEAIRAGDLYIVTHPEMLPIVRERHARIEAAFEDAAARHPLAD